MTTEEAFALVRSTGDVLRFRPEPVPRALLGEILETATCHPPERGEAPPWSILVVEGSERERLVTSLAEAMARHWGLGAIQPRGFATEAVQGAPTLVLFVSRAPSSEGPGGIGAVIQVAQNVVLLAHALGLATYQTFAPNQVPEAALEFAVEHLGATVRGGEPVLLIALGYADGPSEPASAGSGVAFADRSPAVRAAGEGDSLSSDRPGWIGEPAVDLALPPPAPVLRSRHGERVHVVDSFPYNRSLLLGRLAAAGYRVDCFADGETLLSRRAAEPPPDLYVISDSLPDMSGFDFVRRLRAVGGEGGADVPLIVTTARRDSVFRIAGLAAGVDYYLRKPIHLIELYTAVRLLLDRHHLVGELQRATTFQEALLGAMDKVGVLALDEEFRIVYANPGAERMLGYRAEELLGLHPGILASDPGDELTRAAPGGTLRDDVRMRRKDGGRFDAELLRFAIRDRKGNLTGYLGVFVDISERKQLERELGLANQEQRRANAELTRLLAELTATQARLVQQAKMASLGQLVAGVAHEINTPLGAIVSNNDLFGRCFARVRGRATGRSIVGPDERRDLEAIDRLLGVTRTACDRITEIVRELRTFARLDEAERKAVDLHEGLESTLVLVAHLLKGRIAVVRDYGVLPRVDCHPNQLNQVFMNLLVNACQAIEGPGTITIRTRADGDLVQLSIADSGPGIPPAHRDRIFDPGFTTKRPGIGTGLGLSICYQIIEAHGGEIVVSSELGQGAVFTVLLPTRATGAALTSGG